MLLLFVPYTQIVISYCIVASCKIMLILIHEADPQSRPVVIIVFAHVVLSSVRPSVPTFQNKTNFKRKQCSLLARLWVWPSGSLMTPVLSYLIFQKAIKASKTNQKSTLCNWRKPLSSQNPEHNLEEVWFEFKQDKSLQRSSFPMEQ